MKTQVTKKQVIDYFGRNHVLYFDYCAIRELHNTCELIAFRNHISVHDALHSYLSNGEIRRVKNEYLTTGKI